jgi:outer membrane receptor protein involved in Fe transport
MEADGPFYDLDRDTLVTGDYVGTENNLYPSLAFSIGLTDDVVLRASYSKSSARAGLESYSPDISFNEFPSPYDYSNTGSRGNPNLGNQQTENFDLALEYYYKEGSYAAVNLFQKNISGFIEQRNVPMTFEGVYDVRLTVDGDPIQSQAEMQFLILFMLTWVALITNQHLVKISCLQIGGINSDLHTSFTQILLGQKIHI